MTFFPAFCRGHVRLLPPRQRLWPPWRRPWPAATVLAGSHGPDHDLDRWPTILAAAAVATAMSLIDAATFPAGGRHRTAAAVATLTLASAVSVAVVIGGVWRGGWSPTWSPGACDAATVPEDGAKDSLRLPRLSPQRPLELPCCSSVLATHGCGCIVRTVLSVLEICRCQTFKINSCNWLLFLATCCYFLATFKLKWS